MDCAKPPGIALARMMVEKLDSLVMDVETAFCMER